MAVEQERIGLYLLYICVVLWPFFSNSSLRQVGLLQLQAMSAGCSRDTGRICLAYTEPYSTCCRLDWLLLLDLLDCRHT
jgi:hypothetical protein